MRHSRGLLRLIFLLATAVKLRQQRAHWLTCLHGGVFNRNTGTFIVIVKIYNEMMLATHQSVRQQQLKTCFKNMKTGHFSFKTTFKK